MISQQCPSRGAFTKGTNPPIYYFVEHCCPQFCLQWTCLGVPLPFFKKRDVQHVTLHFESVVIPLLPHDILDIGAHLRQLHYLNLDFQVVRERIEDIPTLETVWILTTYCPMLEQLYLPDFNVLGLRSAAPVIRGFNLRTMTSSVLLSSDDEAREVALVMLSAFPNLTDVMKSGFSAVSWDSIAKAINCYWNNRAVNQLQHSGTVLDLHDDTGIRLLAALVSPIAEEEFELDVNQDVQVRLPYLCSLWFTCIHKTTTLDALISRAPVSYPCHFFIMLHDSPRAVRRPLLLANAVYPA